MRTPAVSLTGDPVTDAIIPIAVNLIWSVRTMDRTEITGAFRDTKQVLVNRKAADQTDGGAARALAIVLAAMVPVDLTPKAMLAWLDNTIRSAA